MITLSVEKPEEKTKPEKEKFVKKTSITKKLDAKKKEVAKTAKAMAKGEKQTQERFNLSRFSLRMNKIRIHMV